MVAPSQMVTNATEFISEYKPSTSPSPSQQAALAVLQKFNNQIALAWLTGLRSLRADEDHWFQPRNLPSEQFDAISVLKDCPDELVLAWLDFARVGGSYLPWYIGVSTPADVVSRSV